MSEDRTTEIPQNDSETLTRILANVAQLQEGQLGIGTDIRALRRDIFSAINGTLLDIQVEQRDLHDRLSRLELSNSNPPNSQT
jgi:hypothetical protein